jgi:hypothetical protein
MTDESTTLLIYFLNLPEYIVHINDTNNLIQSNLKIFSL